MTLTEKYTANSGTHYMTGIQALVRLPLDQMRLDRRAGLNTGAFISGYEGSPLGGYDLALGRVKNLLDDLNIHLRPGVNEDLAATAILGSQIHHVAGASKVDGVVGIWYGKGPGVDRSHDALRHANLAGSPGKCAALVLAGDDHTSKSSTIPHQSDFSLMNLAIPTLAPGNTQEVLDLGLAAIAMSRYSGAWAGLKLVTNVCDGAGSVQVDLDRVKFVEPSGYLKVTDHMLVIPNTLHMEVELGRRLEAAKQFARANRLDRVVGNPFSKIGIATSGKAYYDVVDALRALGLAEQVRIAKYALTFPVDPEFTREFATGLQKLIVIEEKRSFLEMQIRDVLFNQAERPVIHGKDAFPAYGELDACMIAVGLGPLLGISAPPVAKTTGTAWRRPNFCSGCPHNRSTLLLEGQLAGGGTGCHGMAVMLGASGRGFVYATHMGGEGAPWIGMAPFSERRHMFQNLGDGTYFHSGSLAIQACVAAGANITFKILYNGHVAMTGGQDAQGALPVPDLTRELSAKGVVKIVVLVEDVSKYTGHRNEFAPNAEIRDRSELEDTMRELEQVSGVTAIVYDQECAAEKRRKRSRGRMETPVERLVIHQEVCEGCGDCRVQSNCASLQTVQTAKGEKMQIHQSSCNLDYTCAMGDCPSFLTIRKPAGQKEKRQAKTAPVVAAPTRIIELKDEPYRILMPGIGGTGVVTINAILATAAVMDGLHVTALDQTGLAQKGGAVTSHLTLSREPMELAAKILVPDVALGFDAAGVEESARVKVLNTAIPGPLNVDATRLAEELLASHLFVNMFLAGFAWQAGLIPISLASIEQAIRLNDVQVDGNLGAFAWGRAHYGKAAAAEAATFAPLDYIAELTAYQDSGYARQHKEFVDRMPAALRDIVARNLYKLMAYKDEYEVARLLTKPGYEGVSYNLHPPFLRSMGLKRKIRLGPWFQPFLRLLAGMKSLRGGALDIFGKAPHRREERELIGWYRKLIEENLSNPAIAELAALPDEIRGYDEIKSRSVAAAKQKARTLCSFSELQQVS